MRVSLSIVATLVASGCGAAHTRSHPGDDGGADARRTDVGADAGCTGDDDRPGYPWCSNSIDVGGVNCCDSPSTFEICVGGAWQCPAGYTRECRGFVDFDELGPWCALETSCSAPAECVLLPESCCGTCGAATPDDMIAVHVASEDENRSMACADPVSCPLCFAATDPYLIATCEGHSCVAKNLHEEDLTLCSYDSDCMLAPLACCACGELSVHETVAYNPAHGSLSSLTCDPAADCPPCVSSFTGMEPACVGGRCVVRLTE